MKITISISNATNKWLDDYCREHGHKKSTYISFLIDRMRMEREDIGTGPISTGPSVEGGQDDIEESVERHLNNSETRLPVGDVEPRRGKCKNCGFVKFVEEHEFVWEEERIIGDLCSDCWKRAQRDGSAR